MAYVEAVAAALRVELPVSDALLVLAGCSQGASMAWRAAASMPSQGRAPRAQRWRA